MEDKCQDILNDINTDKKKKPLADRYSSINIFPHINIKKCLLIIYSNF